jgi:hypothetical protein
MHLTKIKLECTSPRYFSDIVGLNSIIGDTYLQLASHQKKIIRYRKLLNYLSENDRRRLELYNNSYSLLGDYINTLSAEAAKLISLN